MAIHITEECINCGACEPECPNNAIYEGGVPWKFVDGTSVSGLVRLHNGEAIDAGASMPAVSDVVYYIVAEKCTECKGFHNEPRCALVCPVDCCLPDPEHIEDEALLLQRKAFLHDGAPQLVA